MIKNYYASLVPTLTTANPIIHHDEFSVNHDEPAPSIPTSLRQHESLHSPLSAQLLFHHLTRSFLSLPFHQHVWMPLHIPSRFLDLNFWIANYGIQIQTNRFLDTITLYSHYTTAEIPTDTNRRYQQIPSDTNSRNSLLTIHFCIPPSSPPVRPGLPEHLGSAVLRENSWSSRCNFE